MKDGKFLKEIGGRVREMRTNRGLSVRALGALCQMDYSNLSRFENGQKNIHILALKKISDQLSIDIKDLL